MAGDDLKSGVRSPVACGGGTAGSFFPSGAVRQPGKESELGRAGTHRRGPGESGDGKLPGQPAASPVAERAERPEFDAFRSAPAGGSADAGVFEGESRLPVDGGQQDPGDGRSGEESAAGAAAADAGGGHAGSADFCLGTAVDGGGCRAGRALPVCAGSDGDRALRDGDDGRRMHRIHGVDAVRGLELCAASRRAAAGALRARHGGGTGGQVHGDFPAAGGGSAVAGGGATGAAGGGRARRESGDRAGRFVRLRERTQIQKLSREDGPGQGCRPWRVSTTCPTGARRARSC